MRKSLMLAMTALTAAFLLATAVGTAGARSFGVSSTTFRVVWTGLDFSGGLIRCEVTLEGSFHYRTFAKVERSLIGLVTAAAVRHACPTEGQGWTDNGIEEFLGRRSNRSLPWHLTYERFLGSLPRIEGIVLLLRGASFVINLPGLCLGRYGKAEDNLSALVALDASGNATSLAPVEGRNRASLREVLGEPFCPAQAEFRNAAAVSVLGSTQSIRVTLI